MKKTILFSSMIFLFFLRPAFATETDNFTPLPELPDSRAWLNEHMNTALTDVADETKTCNPHDLYKILYAHLGGGFFAKLEVWSKINPNVMKIPISKSIYQEVANKYVSHFDMIPAKMGNFYTEYNLRIGDVRMGDDKLGHFFSNAYTLFYAMKNKENSSFVDVQGFLEIAGDIRFGVRSFLKNSPYKGFELAMQLNHELENGQWGLTGPGVKSYGDMMANWEGLKFWLSLAEGPIPYFQCVKGKFEKKRDFDFKDYVNQGWDESVNCSTMVPLIDASVKEVIKRNSLPTCPVSKAKCVQLVKQYHDVGERLLSPECWAAGGGK